MWNIKILFPWATVLWLARAEFQELWFQVSTDHYSFEPVVPFQLRYFVEDQYYNGSSILFYAGNEAPIEQFLDNSGILLELAQEFGSLVVFAEHRYYGRSLPFGSSSLQPGKNISFLTVEQAMQDFNTLNVMLRSQSSTNPAVIAFGGSYGGNLALWLRLKNPNLWAGAIASSATPLKHLLRSSNAFAAIETKVYANVSAECPDLVRQGWKELFKTASDQQIQSRLGLCEKPHNRDLLHDWISGALETMVQYGYPYPTQFYNPLPAYPFAETCYRMIRSNHFNGTGLDALRAAVDVYYNYTGTAGSCYDATEVVRHSMEHSIQKGRMDRVGQYLRMDLDGVATQQRALLGMDKRVSREYSAWGYQVCTEVYQPMPTNGITDFEVPYTPNKELYFETCRRIWGVEPRPNWEEMTFMGSDIGTGSNIFLTNGQLDPWRAAGIQSQPNNGANSGDSSIIVRTIEHGAHHLDLRSSHILDPSSVRAVRQEQKGAIATWITDWYRRHSGTHNVQQQNIENDE